MRHDNALLNSSSQGQEFLDLVWRNTKGYRLLSAKRGSQWVDVAVAPGESLDAFFRRFPRGEYDLYFAPVTFSRPHRRREYALRVAWAWCDIDRGDLNAFRPKPSIIWRTSPGRHQ